MNAGEDTARPDSRVSTHMKGAVRIDGANDIIAGRDERVGLIIQRDEITDHRDEVRIVDHSGNTVCRSSTRTAPRPRP